MEWAGHLGPGSSLPSLLVLWPLPSLDPGPKHLLRCSNFLMHSVFNVCKKSNMSNLSGSLVRAEKSYSGLQGSR